MLDLDAIVRRQWRVYAEWQESEGEHTAQEAGPLVCQDVPALIAEIQRVRDLAEKWRRLSTNAAADGSDARARAIAECADELEGKRRAIKAGTLQGE